jgi:hypothetical protein
LAKQHLCDVNVNVESKVSLMSFVQNENQCTYFKNVHYEQKHLEKLPAVTTAQTE